MRRDTKFWVMLPLLCVWPMAANADDGMVARVMSECGGADLPQASLDSCLERVRVLEETEPSPQLQTLEAALEQRESVRPPAARASAPSRVVEIAPQAVPAATDDADREQPSLQPASPDSSSSRSGPAIEDEPPVADSPDAAAGPDDTGDPPRS